MSESFPSLSKQEQQKLLEQAQQQMDAAANDVWADRSARPRFKIVFVEGLREAAHSSIAVEVAPNNFNTYNVKLDPNDYMQTSQSGINISGALAHEACHIKHGDKALDDPAERREQELNANRCVGEAGPQYALSRAGNLLGLHKAGIPPDVNHPPWLDSLKEVQKGLKEHSGLILSVNP